MIKIGIYEYEDGTVDVQIAGEGLFFEFGADSVEEAKRIVNELKNADVAVNPNEEWWKKDNRVSRIKK